MAGDVPAQPFYFLMNTESKRLPELFRGPFSRQFGAMRIGTLAGEQQLTFQEM